MRIEYKRERTIIYMFNLKKNDKNLPWYIEVVKPPASYLNYPVG